MALTVRPGLAGSEVVDWLLCQALLELLGMRYAPCDQAALSLSAPYDDVMLSNQTSHQFSLDGEVDFLTYFHTYIDWLQCREICQATIARLFLESKQMGRLVSLHMNSTCRVCSGVKYCT